MDYNFFDFLTLVGALVLFLFGMKMMSEGLQKVAGGRMRKILGVMTSNRFLGIFTGVLITGIIQSSSATTVMVVSFVNAGLLTLTEAISVIMGANIGTTITAWIISLIGFKVDMGQIALPLLAIAFPLIFSSKSTKKSWGEFILGFCILFMGLDFIKGSVPDLNSNPELLSALQSFSNYGFWSVLLFLCLGSVLTVIIQSSSATIVLTLVMCYNGWISFELAAAMVLGENIGTTITANIAAIIANTTARRAALCHTIFNIVGVIWVLIFFKPMLHLVDKLCIWIDGSSPYLELSSVPIALSLFHTIFNITNTLIQVPFVTYIEKLSTLIIRKKSDEDEEFGLKYINIGVRSTAELSILQVRKEIIEYSKMSQKMFNQAKKQFLEVEDKKSRKAYEKMEKHEISMNKFEAEIAQYLTKISEEELSIQSSRRIRALLKTSDNIESVADNCYSLSLALLRKTKKQIWFTPEQRADVFEMFKLLDISFNITIDSLSQVNTIKTDLSDIEEIEEKINTLRNNLRIRNTDNLYSEKYTYKSSVVYMDIITICEIIGDHLINICEAVAFKEKVPQPSRKKYY